jgi:DNA-binding GntR family transcriptional regulator
MLIRGEFESGQHLQEIPLARQLNASRTPVRLALGALAQEGLLVHKPNSGFLVREFTIKEISDAVLIRGELEAVAARMVAEKGMSDGTATALRETLDMASHLVSDGRITVERYSRWFDLNGAFHDLIVKETANATLSNAISQISKIPLVGAGVMAASIDNEDRINEVVAKADADPTLADRLGFYQQAPLYVQFWELLKRQVVVYIRNPIMSTSRFIAGICTALFFGGAFWQLGRTAGGYDARCAEGFAYKLMVPGFGSAAIAYWVEKRKAFYHEEAAGL